MHTIATHELLEEHHDTTNSQPPEAGPCCEEGHVLLKVSAKPVIW